MTNMFQENKWLEENVALPLTDKIRQELCVALILKHSNIWPELDLMCLDYNVDIIWSQFNWTGPKFREVGYNEFVAFALLTLLS